MWQEPNSSELRECVYSVQLLIKNSAGDYQTVFEDETREMQIQLTSLIPGQSYLVEMTAVHFNYHSYGDNLQGPSRKVQLSFKQGTVRTFFIILYCLSSFHQTCEYFYIFFRTIVVNFLQKLKNQSASTVHLALIV